MTVKFVDTESWRHFATAAWPHTPARLRRLPDWLASCVEWGELSSVSEWASRRRPVCKVWQLHDGVPIQVRSGASTAPAFYDAGCTVVWDDFDEGGIAPLQEGMADALGSPLRRTHANALTSPAGSNVALHFDAHEVCILQVIGWKRWWVSENLDLHCPSYGYLDRFRAPLLEHEADSWPLHPPSKESMYTFDVGPGQLVLTPRGWWHTTSALTDCVSITMAMVSKTRGELGIVAPTDGTARCVPAPWGEGCRWMPRSHRSAAERPPIPCT
jgi:ribosomal protein L16 Arg81 hydroxylase